MKSTGDYDTPARVTHVSLTTVDSILSVSPLHSIMWTFDFVKQLAYHLRAKVHQLGKGKQTLKRPSISKDSRVR